MKIFVTGGRGMVGRNLSSLARKREKQLIAPARNELDLMNYNSVVGAFRRLKPDVVIHAAGHVGGIQANICYPYDFFLQNVQIGLNVVRAAYEVGVPRLLNLGSSCMYPYAAPNPLSEKSLLQGEFEPTNEGYGLAKVAVAKTCEYLAVQHGCNYRTLIPCNLYGKWDNFDPQHSHMIPGVIRKIHHAITQREDTVAIWGNGQARREFMYAEDLAAFILDYCHQVEVLPQYMNIGVGSDISINEYYKEISAVLGYQGCFVHDLSKPEGMKQKLVDISVQRRLKWRVVTPLREGLKHTYDYFLREVL